MLKWNSENHCSKSLGWLISWKCDKEHPFEEILEIETNFFWMSPSLIGIFVVNFSESMTQELDCGICSGWDPWNKFPTIELLWHESPVYEHLAIKSPHTNLWGKRLGFFWPWDRFERKDCYGKRCHTWQESFSNFVETELHISREGNLIFRRNKNSLIAARNSHVAASGISHTSQKNIHSTPSSLTKEFQFTKRQIQLKEFEQRNLENILDWKRIDSPGSKCQIQTFKSNTMKFSDIMTCFWSKESNRQGTHVIQNLTK